MDVWGSIPDRGMKMITQLHIVQRLRMHGAAHPLPHYVLVKHKDSFTFTFTLQVMGNYCFHSLFTTFFLEVHGSI
jgi:hypothetical protein